MDLALLYNPTSQSFDLALVGADLARDDTLATAVLTSLLCDRLAQAHEVGAGADRRGWWADAFDTSTSAYLFGSRLWLLEREKQTSATMQRCKAYVQEALQWIIDDGLATSITVAVFAPRMGWLVAQVEMAVAGQVRRYRFEWDDAAQVWRLAGEAA